MKVVGGYRKEQLLDWACPGDTQFEDCAPPQYEHKTGNFQIVRKHQRRRNGKVDDHIYLKNDYLH